MMFLVRSTFWFGLVVSNMPLQPAIAPVAGDPARPMTADIARMVGDACAHEAASCRAVLAAVAAGLAASDLDRRPNGLVRSADLPRPSIDTLTSNDRAPEWRGPSAPGG